MYKFNKIILLISFHVISCSSPKDLSKSVAEFATKEIIKVELKNLVNNKSFYHGKYIETEGYFKCGFEISSLRFKDSLKYNLTDTLVYSGIYFEEIWVYGNPYKRIECDSFNNKQVVIKGMFDTTKHGHDDWYFAGIENAFIYLK